MGYNVCSGNTSAVPLGNSIGTIVYPNEDQTVCAAKAMITIESQENTN